MFFRNATTPKVRSKAPRGLPALPGPGREVVLRARRSMDLLVASRRAAQEPLGRPVEKELPPLSDENRTYLESYRVAAATADVIPESFLKGLNVVSEILGAYSADELDQLLHECAPSEREVLLASLVLRLRRQR